MKIKGMETLLTQEEVDGLPDGVLVRITWSGGNGPHIYAIRVDMYGNRRAALHPPGGLYELSPPYIIHFVGKERCQTRVSLVEHLPEDQRWCGTCENALPPGESAFGHLVAHGETLEANGLVP